MTNEQGNAWRERAELAERENERLHAVVERMRSALKKIHENCEGMADDALPHTVLAGHVRFADGMAEWGLGQ